MKELVVISGKGGTGKTSVAASLAALAGQVVVADCDVDAADMHLLLAPEVKERHEFRCGNEAVIRPKDCHACGACLAVCRFEAVRKEDGAFRVDPAACEGCGVCVRFCPAGAIDFPERLCGEWMLSETRLGPLVHARLGVAAENSGKLVSTVRREAARVAAARCLPLVVVDGPPGIGCPVIASLTGAALVLVVTEPTVSGEHDLARVLALAKHFQLTAAVCVNKWDINPEMAARIEAMARLAGARVVDRICYDRGVTMAQTRGLTAVETDTPCGEDIRKIWEELKTLLV